MSDVERTQRAYARFAGLMFLVVLAASVAGLVLSTAIAGSGTANEQAQRIIESEGLYRFALVCGLSGSLFTILLATGLYVTVRPVDRNLALVGLLFRAGESVIGAVGIVVAFVALEFRLAIESATAPGSDQLGALASLLSAAPSAEIAAIYFSLGSTMFFYVLLRSPLIPKALSAFGMFSSVTYAALWFARLVVPESSGLAVIGSLPILIAELSTGFWLLIKGIRIFPPDRPGR
jgi:hypothetical protein